MKTNSYQEKRFYEAKKKKLEKRLFIMNMVFNTIALLLPILLIVSVLLYDNGGILRTVAPYLFGIVMTLYIGDVIYIFINDIKERRTKK